MVFHSFSRITMVATPKSFLNPFSFLGCLPVAISVATAGDSTGDSRESSHLIRYAHLMWFFLMFSFPLLLFVYSCIPMCLYIISFWVNCVLIIFSYVDRCFGIALLAWEIFWLFCRRGFGYASFSRHTHIVHIMSGALYPGLCNLELKGNV